VDNNADRASSHWFIAGLMAVAVIGILVFLPIEFVFDMNSPDFNPMALVPVFLGAIGLYHLALAVRWTHHARRFGAATMELKGAGTARMGGRVEGVVRTATTLAPQGDYTLVLQCVDVHEFRNSRASEAGTHHNRSFVVWEQALQVPAQGIDSSQGIPFAFQMPAAVGDPQNATPRDPNRPTMSFKASFTIPFMKPRIVTNAAPLARAWQLQVSAPMPGTDFHAQFDVPVRTEDERP
jgi:hypothetical protein